MPQSFIPLILVSAAGLWLAFAEFPAEWPQGCRHSIHVLVFALWTWALFITLRTSLRRTDNLSPTLAIAYPCAVLAELLQFAIPHHSPECYGVAANLLGVSMAGFLALTVRRLRRRARDGAGN